MIPDDLVAERRAVLLDPSIMAPPIVWLASDEARDVHDERIVATEFASWLAAR
jgi:gluconate 5-dehydrogenase